MADIAVLGIKVDTSQVKGASKDLDGLTAAGGRADKSTKSLERSFGDLRGVIATVGIAAIANQTIKTIDSYTKLTAQIKNATDTQLEFNTAMEDVQRISAVAQADISSITTLYARLNLSLEENGASQQEIATITETVALALKAGGASAAEASSAMLQLSQAFGSGVLRGEEFNAVMESAPGLMRQLASSIGVPVGQLRSLASEGVITADKLQKAFTDSKYLSTLRQQAKEIQTISGAFQVLRNQATLAIGELDKTTDISKKAADALLLVGDNIKYIGLASAALVGGRLAQYLALSSAELVKSVAASRANALANVELAKAEAATTAATVAATTARVSELRAVMASTQGYTQLAVATDGMSAAQSRAAIAAQAHTSARNAALASEISSAAQARAAAAASAQASAAQSRATAVALGIETEAQARAAAAATAHAASLAKLDAANKAASLSTAAAGTAAGIAGRAIGFLGGPIGALITVLGLAATAWVAFGDSAEEAAKKNVSAADKALEKIKALREQSLVTRAGGNPLAVELQEAGARYAAAIANVRMQPNIHGVLVQTGTEQMQKAKVELERVTKLYQEAERLMAGQSSTNLGNQNSTFERLSKGLNITSLELEKLNKLEAEARKEMAAGNLTASQYQKILEGINAERKSLLKTGSSRADNTLKKNAEDLKNLINSFEDAARPAETISQQLERQLSAYGRIDPAVKAYLQSLLDKVKAEELAQLQADSLADSQEHLNKTLADDEGLKAWKKLEEEAASLYAETRTPLEQFEAKILDIKKLLDNGLISPDTAGRASADAYADFVKQNETAADEITEFWKEAARNMQDAMGDFFFNAMQGNLSDLEGSFKATIDRMVANLMASQLNNFLFGADFGKTGQIGGKVGEIFSGGVGDFFGDLFGGFFADGGYLPPGKWGVAGEKGPEPIFGGKTGVTVQSNKQQSSAPVIHLTQNITTQDAGSFMRSSRQVAQRAKRQLDIAMRVS